MGSRATAPERRSWARLLHEAIRPQFRVEVYVPDPSDRVLFGALCAVSGCPARGAHHVKRDHYLCTAHGKQWRGDGRPNVERWVRVGARPLKTLMLAAHCEVRECPRSVFHRGLCYPHFGRWKLAGRPDHAAWTDTADAVAVSQGARCQLPGCRFPAMGKWRFCDTHNLHFAHLRASERAATPEDLLAWAAQRQRSSAPRYDLRELPELVRLELQFALQCRHGARGARLEPVAFRTATRWVAELGVGSLMERSGRFFEHAAHERFASARVRGRGCPELAWVRYARARLQDLRDEHSGIDAWEWDTWTVERIGVDARYAHQPHRRIYFTGIESAWLRELAKRWARWRLTSVSLSPEAAAGTTNALRSFCRWLAAEHALPATPRELTRGLLERYLAHVHARELSTGQKRRLLGNLRTFLDDIRMHEWAPGLPGKATYFDGEIPRRSTRRLPRFVDEFVMGQIEHPDNLARLPDHTTQTAIVILIETGLRSIDALRLPFDPVTVDAAGAPYLVYTNHKLGREAVIPISQHLLEQIRLQQADVARRYASEQRHFLLPRVRSNPDGRLAFSWATLCRRLARWLNDCEIRDATGRPVHVTPHQFRHTLATRLVNNEVPLDTVRRLLDHNSPDDRPLRPDQRRHAAPRVGALPATHQHPRRSRPARPRRAALGRRVGQGEPRARQADAPQTPAFRGNGSTRNPSSAPGSNAYATATLLPLRACRTPNAPARPRYASATPCLPRTSVCARRTPPCATSSRCFTATAAKRSAGEPRATQHTRAGSAMRAITNSRWRAAADALASEVLIHQLPVTALDQRMHEMASRRAAPVHKDDRTASLRQRPSLARGVVDRCESRGAGSVRRLAPRDAQRPTTMALAPVGTWLAAATHRP